MRNIVLGYIAFVISCGCSKHGEEPPYEPDLLYQKHDRIAVYIDGFIPDSLWIRTVSGFCSESKSRLTATAYGDSAFAVDIPIPGKRSNVLTVEKTDSSTHRLCNIHSVITIDGKEYALDCEMHMYSIRWMIADFMWGTRRVKWDGENVALRTGPRERGYAGEIFLIRDPAGRLRANHGIVGETETNF